LRFMKNHFVIIIIALGVSSFSLKAQRVPVSTGSEVLQKDAQDALDFHNKVRADVKSPPLQWSEELARYAQSWADHLAADCEMEHRPNSGQWAQKYGENIFWGEGEDYTALHASESWYGEIEEYKYGPLTDKNWYKTGHYTQMVWKSTTHVGMGMAVCRNGAILIVANYDPSGNYMGQKPY
jgi:pathogenesis-related protein 1